MTGSFRRWTIGNVRITRLIEMGPVDIEPETLLPQATTDIVRATSWLHPNFATAEGQIRLNFQCFLIEAAGRKILVDTCIGEYKALAVDILNDLTTGFLGTLTEAGAGPEDIDTVLCTHLHFDHVGWNTRLVDGAWAPTFPKARYLFGRTEVDFTLTNEAHAGDESVAQSIRPILDAGLADFVETDHRVCEGVTLFPTPGHTPGHVSVRIESGSQAAIISGDAVHHPLQMARPDIASSFCHEPERGSDTRRKLFADLAGQPILFIGTHFTEPSAGHVVEDGATWRLDIGLG